MSKKNDRRKEIVKLLQMNNGATIKDLSGILDVSEMTIRRDLQILESEGVVNLVHGAAIYNPQSLNKRLKEYSLVTAKNQNNDAKNRIGKYAASLIDENDYIIIDTGSTGEKIVPNLPINKKFTLVCYTSNVMANAITKPNIKLIMGGGEYKPETMLFLSNETTKMLSRLRATKVFVSASGIDKKFGVTCMNNYELDYKNVIKSIGQEIILVVDSSKFGKVDNAYFGEIDEFDLIITDKDIPKEWEELILKKEVKLVKV
ncbi:MAG: DeoR/GlpR family DNA-binding transcription regulator [Tissierellia bacterium]|nr:DeoR/GlpR family DNA-binding transcription regulator [Tissierellia bacterium]